MKKKGTVVMRVVLGLILLVAGIYEFTNAVNNQHKENEIAQQVEQDATADLKSAYGELEIGMTYEECVTAIGSEGELFGETESDLGKTTVYLWKPEGTVMTGIEAYFDNDKLSQKTWLE